MIEQYSEQNAPNYEKIPPFRFVTPYEHCYKTIAKQRWFKKNLLDAMEEEFRAYDREYYQKAILNGKILINKLKVQPDYIIQQGDEIAHYAYRNEPPILDLKINIIHEDEYYLVVDKPPSMIVHTGGGYHYNTLMGVLFFDYNKRNLYTLHRLDRLTSGLIIFAKDYKLAQQFHEANNKLSVKKTYYARVGGNFPSDINESTRPQYCISMKDGVFSCCDETQSSQLKAKPAKTIFNKLWYDNETDSSLIECHPITGKTHQIRVHLADIGYPILNDVAYGGRMIGNRILAINFTNLNFKKINQRIRQMNDLIDEGNNTQIQINIYNDNEQKLKQINDNDEQDKVQKKIKINSNESVTAQEQIIINNDKKNTINGFKIYEWDYDNHPLEIYLHSFKYEFNDLQFQSEQPYWVQKQLPNLSNR